MGKKEKKIDPAGNRTAKKEDDSPETFKEAGTSNRFTVQTKISASSMLSGDLGPVNIHIAYPGQ